MITYFGWVLNTISKIVTIKFSEVGRCIIKPRAASVKEHMNDKLLGPCLARPFR